MEMSFAEWMITVLIALFYGSVISIILLSYWKVHMAFKEIQEVKNILLDLQGSLGQSRR